MRTCEADFPEKTKGLALSRTLPDGRRLLFVSTDNDFHPETESRIDVFAIESAHSKLAAAENLEISTMRSDRSPTEPPHPQPPRKQKPP